MEIEWTSIPQYFILGLSVIFENYLMLRNLPPLCDTCSAFSGLSQVERYRTQPNRWLEDSFRTDKTQHVWQLWMLSYNHICLNSLWDDMGYPWVYTVLDGRQIRQSVILTSVLKIKCWTDIGNEFQSVHWLCLGFQVPPVLAVLWMWKVSFYNTTAYIVWKT